LVISQHPGISIKLAATDFLPNFLSITAIDVVGVLLITCAPAA
jgi:hypothetical protein